MGLMAAIALAAGPASRPTTMLREDPPLVLPPKAGDLRGTISLADRVSQLSAVSRVTGRRYLPARFDKGTGEFVFEALPGDARYDLCLTLADGRRIEGIDLDWVEARLLRLAELRRQDLGLPPQVERAFTREDAAALLKYVADLKDFTDARRVLFLHGYGARATMLVEVMRTADFYAEREDEVIWRVELWYFTYEAGGWQRQANTERVLERMRIPVAQWKTITLVYEPSLSMHVDPDGRCEPVRYKVPDMLDPAKGRLAGTEFKQDTQPALLGIGSPASQPSTQGVDH